MRRWIYFAEHHEDAADKAVVVVCIIFLVIGLIVTS